MLKTRNFVLNAGDGSVRGRNLYFIDGFCIKNDGLCIKNDGLCINNDGFCIKNDECNKNGQGCTGLKLVVRGARFCAQK